MTGIDREPNNSATQHVLDASQIKYRSHKMENYDEFGGYVVVSYVSATSYNCEKKHFFVFVGYFALGSELKRSISEYNTTRTETWCAAVNSLSKCQEAAGGSLFSQLL